MFARTPRLMLRPGWPDDAPALAAALGAGCAIGGAAAAGRPCAPSAAAGHLGRPQTPFSPELLVFARDERAPALLGIVRLASEDRDSGMFDCWIRPDRRGRGYAAEAGRALIDIADMLGIVRLRAVHRIDHPAADALTTRLGFATVGDVVGTDGVTVRHVRRGAPPVEALAA